MFIGPLSLLVNPLLPLALSLPGAGRPGPSLSILGSSFRVCWEEVDHHRELQPQHQLWRKVSEVLFSVAPGSQLLSQAMNRHLKVPRNPWSQEQKGSVLSPFSPLTSFQASCICQGSTLWDVSRNFP